MGRARRQRRQPHGSAWHWVQTDCWYYTPPGTRKRVPLFDEQGNRIRGKDNRQTAERALARERIARSEDLDGSTTAGQPWKVAKVCSEYIQYCQRGVAAGTISKNHCYAAVNFLNDLCSFCGALTVTKLKKTHIATWIERHTSWRSTATHRTVIALVLAAFNHAADNYGIANPLKGLKKPKSQPRLDSISAVDEQTLYGATEECFRNFLFAAIHTGLRPFSELARLTADDVEETPRGMMWRVHSTKTKKTRKIPVRPEVAELTRRLTVTAPKGSGKPLLRNTKGDPWTNTAGVVRFLVLKKKLGWKNDPRKTKYSCYSCRHTFVHRMLSGYWNEGKGCSIETLAELIGDTPKVAFDHYGREWGQHYQDPLWAAVGGGKAPTRATRKAARQQASRAPRPKASTKPRSTNRRSSTTSKQRTTGHRQTRNPQ